MLLETALKILGARELLGPRRAFPGPAGLSTQKLTLEHVSRPGIIWPQEIVRNLYTLHSHSHKAS
jgi:hypothetical protein